LAAFLVDASTFKLVVYYQEMRNRNSQSRKVKSEKSRETLYQEPIGTLGSTGWCEVRKKRNSLTLLKFREILHFQVKEFLSLLGVQTINGTGSPTLKQKRQQNFCLSTHI
jgi:hypothetical protein